MACFRNKIDIQREIEIEKETEIETCGSCTGQASRVDHKQRRTREQLSPFGQRARIHHPGHREQEARRYRGERSIDMASSLRQLLPLKRIPAVLGYARRPAPPPPPAAPVGLRTFTNGGASSSNAYKAAPPLTRTSPGSGMYHWRHGEMVKSDAHPVG